MTRLVTSLAALVVITATAALAQNLVVIKERQKHYEEMGKAAKPTGKMLKGEEDFDLATVKNAIKVFQEKAAVLPKLFPDDSKTGEDTEALPALWKNKSDFEERFKKLAEAAKAAETSITDEITFGEEWPKVMGNCGGCHKKYREEKKK